MSAPSATEADLLATVVDAAHLGGFRVAHFRPARSNRGWVTPVAFDGQGFPDLVLANGAQGRVIFAELKSDHGRLSPHQEAWQDELAGARSVESYLWRPCDLNGALRVLGVAP